MITTKTNATGNRRNAILALYDTPGKTANTVREGYDKEHAERTSRIILIAAKEIGIRNESFKDLEDIALLHDIGRRGMNPELFGKIFTLAKDYKLPTRITEMRKKFPEMKDSEAPQYFASMIKPVLQYNGVEMDNEVIDHINMRMAYKERTHKILVGLKPELDRLGVDVKPWMEKVILYYYYPQELMHEPEDVRKMGMLLVGCENFEAYNNRQRGRDYYGRENESLRDAFRVIERFEAEGVISHDVLNTLRKLTANDTFDSIIKESRELPQNAKLHDNDIEFKKELKLLLSRRG